MFEIERFVADCRAAIKDTQSTKAVREVVAEAVADPSGLLKAWANRPVRASRSSISRTISPSSIWSGRRA